MTRPDPHERYEELAAGYALHALEPEDEQLFRTHLDGCAQCRGDLDAHAAVLAQLAYAPDAAEPPPTLLEGIRAGVRSSGREVVAASDQRSGPTSGDVLDRPAGARPVRLDDARRRRDAARLSRAGRWTGLAAAAALVVSLAVWTTVGRDGDDASGLSEQMAAAVSELRDESTTTVRLEGDAGDVVAVALVREGELSLVVDGLPVNDDATSYVVWGEDAAGERRAVGVFDVTRDDLDVQEGLPLQAEVPPGTRLLVTEEQGDEAPASPTLPVLAVGTV